MKCFHCDNCGMMVFFESEYCVKCGESLGFLPDTLEMSSGKTSEGSTSSNGNGAPGNCANRNQHQVCNWLIPSGDSNPFCLSCRLNEMIPDLTIAGNRERWLKLERAKRRCLYTFLRLGLPVETGEDKSRVALRFRFLSDGVNMPPVLTGHSNGVITINTAEADGDERERRRVDLHEPYRTLVGHIRHESGHYYWDRLIAQSSHLTEFRELFGDETVNYDEALKQYYQRGPAVDWPQRTVTAYASLHPWEDWAETWAHYLHIVDTLETAASFGLGFKKTTDENKEQGNTISEISGNLDNFEDLLAGWIPLTCALNSINRGMGLSDLYPFIITDAVVDKLSFVHELIQAEARHPKACFQNQPNVLPESDRSRLHQPA